MSLILREARIRSSIGYQCYVNGWGSIAMPNRHLTIPDDVFPLPSLKYEIELKKFTSCFHFSR